MINAIVENMYLGRLSSGTTYNSANISIIMIRFLQILYKNLKQLGNACDMETLCLGTPQQIPLDKLNEYYERYPFYLEAYQIMCANCKRLPLYLNICKLIEEIQ